ncbi:hypothetical protein ABTE11_21585 [Acinetobacter baumannii]
MSLLVSAFPAPAMHECTEQWRKRIADRTNLKEHQVRPDVPDFASCAVTDPLP